MKTKFDTTDSFKYKKVGLIKDGHIPTANEEPIFVALPKTKTYAPLTKNLEKRVNSGKYRF